MHHLFLVWPIIQPNYEKNDISITTNWTLKMNYNNTKNVKLWIQLQKFYGFQPVLCKHNYYSF